MWFLEVDNTKKKKKTKKTKGGVNITKVILYFQQTPFPKYYSFSLYLNSFSLPKVVDKPIKNITLVRWYPPPPSFFKLNTNESTLGNPGLAGAGGLIRKSDGSWCSGFIRNIGIASSFAAELWGVRDGLILAKQHNIHKIMIELDAKAVIDLLLSDNYTSICCHPLSALIIDCMSLIHSFEEARILHTHHEENFCADLLAKEGSKTLNSYVKLFSPPSIIVSQLMADIWGGFLPSCL